MTNDTKPSRHSFFDREIDIRMLAFILLFLCVFAVFMNQGLSLFLGPVMAVLMVYLYTSGYPEVITALIIVANDALGTIFFGKLSFQYLLLALTILILLRKRGITRAELVLLVASLILQLELVIVRYNNARTLLLSLTYILALLALPKGEKTWFRFSRGLLVTIALIALHACLTGGVEFTEYEEHVLLIRRGILGVGIGDPNYSSFLLNIGVVCAWCDRELKVIWKLLLTALFLGAMTITVSVAGLLALIILILLFFLIGEKKSKGVMILCILALVVAILLGVYIGLPEELRLSSIDNYIARVTEKLTAFGQGDMSTVTTNRSDLLSDYLYYIFSQSPLRFLFGGNTLNIIRGLGSHNTYIDLMLQVGLTGTLLFLWWVGFKVKRAFKLPLDNAMRKQIILWKALALFMAFNLSFHSNSLWALWMLFLVLL